MTDLLDPLRDASTTRRLAGAGCAMTLWRWQRDAAVQFPPADVVIRRRNYWKASTIEAWRRRMAAAHVASAAPPAAALKADRAA